MAILLKHYLNTADAWQNSKMDVNQSPQTKFTTVVHVTPSSLSTVKVSNYRTSHTLSFLDQLWRRALSRQLPVQ